MCLSLVFLQHSAHPQQYNLFLNISKMIPFHCERRERKEVENISWQNILQQWILSHIPHCAHAQMTVWMNCVLFLCYEVNATVPGLRPISTICPANIDVRAKISFGIDCNINGDAQFHSLYLVNLLLTTEHSRCACVMRRNHKQKRCGLKFEWNIFKWHDRMPPRSIFFSFIIYRGTNVIIYTLSHTVHSRTHTYVYNANACNARIRTHHTLTTPHKMAINVGCSGCSHMFNV